MKRIMFILSFVFMAIPIVLGSEIVKELSFHYDLKYFQINEKDGMVGVKLISGPDMTRLYSDYNHPDLPQFIHTIFYGNSYDKLEIEWETAHSERQIVKENVDINTKNPLDSLEHLITGWVKYNLFDNYSMEPLKVTCLQNHISAWVSPFIYDPETRTLYFVEDINIKIRIRKKIKGPKSDIKVIRTSEMKKIR
ncbi:MAG: hypothetical protein K2H76_06910 [Muribaculaceae bacterium]|nr:hypothetical protein [Muribaculaceae bacterium]MDE6027799.1 hypothetical protein [Muribaculaceae bacterium]